MTSTDDDWTEVERNLRRERIKWGRLKKFLEREVADNRTTGRFYVSVVKSVFLFGSKTWVLNPRLENSPAGFHHRVERRMAGMGPKRQTDGTWVYPPIGAVLAMVGLDKIGVYIACR